MSHLPVLGGCSGPRDLMLGCIIWKILQIRIVDFMVGVLGRILDWGRFYCFSSFRVEVGGISMGL